MNTAPRQAGYIADDSPVTGISLMHDEGTGGNTDGGFGIFPLFPLGNCSFTSCPATLQARSTLRQFGSASDCKLGIFMSNQHWLTLHVQLPPLAISLQRLSQGFRLKQPQRVAQGSFDSPFPPLPSRPRTTSLLTLSTTYSAHSRADPFLSHQVRASCSAAPSYRRVLQSDFRRIHIE